eukprot:360342-Chlamydomonas_euryale.AAC.4
MTVTSSMGSSDLLKHLQEADKMMNGLLKSVDWGQGGVLGAECVTEGAAQESGWARGAGPAKVSAQGWAAPVRIIQQRERQQRIGRPRSNPLQVHTPGVVIFSRTAHSLRHAHGKSNALAPFRRAGTIQTR